MLAYTAAQGRIQYQPVAVSRQGQHVQAKSFGAGSNAGALQLQRCCSVTCGKTFDRGATRENGLCCRLRHSKQPQVWRVHASQLQKVFLPRSGRANLQQSKRPPQMVLHQRRRAGSCKLWAWDKKVYMLMMTTELSR